MYAGLSLKRANQTFTIEYETVRLGSASRPIHEDFPALQVRGVVIEADLWSGPKPCLYRDRNSDQKSAQKWPRRGSVHKRLGDGKRRMGRTIFSSFWESKGWDIRDSLVDVARLDY